MRAPIAGTILFFSAVCAIITDAPAPPKSVVKAPTPEEVKDDILREYKLQQYAAATKTALAVFRYHIECNKYADLVGESAVDTGLSPRILAALAIVESGCNPSAVSITGDYGLFQVNAKMHHISPSVLLDPTKNAHIASEFLSQLVRQYGAVEGLHRYNGLGNPTNSYAERVLQIAGYKS